MATSLFTFRRSPLLHPFRHLTAPLFHVVRALKTAELPTSLIPNPEPLLRLSSRDTSPSLLPNPESLLGLFYRYTLPSLLHVKDSASAPTRSPLLTESAGSDDVARANRSQETKLTMFSLAANFSWSEKIIGLVLLWFIFSSTAGAGAEARAYPGSESSGSQGQGVNATTSFGLDNPIFAGLAAECNVTAVFEKMKGEYDSKLLYMCGPPCCGKNYHGPCCKCCSKGNGHAPELPVNHGSGVGGAHGGDNGHN